MTSARLSVSVDGERSTMTLARFLEENEGAPKLCAQVLELERLDAQYGGVGMTEVSAGGVTIKRVAGPVRMPSRWVRLAVPWNFDGSKVATVAIHRDSGAISFRPRGRRRVSFVDLGTLLAQVASKEAKLAALAKRKARRSRK